MNIFPHHLLSPVSSEVCTVESSVVVELFFTHDIIIATFCVCVDVTKLWFSDGLQPNQLWFETKTSVVEVKAYSNDSQAGKSRLL